MKRLMTMLSATAVAAFAVGAANGDTLNTGTGFETGAYILGGNLNTEKDDAGEDLESESDRVWGSIPDLESGVAVVSNWNGETIPASYDKARGDNYLKLDSAPLISRYAQAGGEAVEMTSEGVYIDTLVQFTVSEDTPDQTTEDGDKLCIWVNVDSETGATNLMVKAGYISDESGENITPTAYTTDYSFGGDDNGWHRLTVKAINGIDEVGVLAGFVIYVDGVAVKTSMSVMCNEFAEASPLVVEGAFPSLISSLSSEGGTLQSIGFKGTGSIDNVQFTTENPLPAPGGDDWADDPTEIEDNTPAATQYPALADSALATADAKKLTVWATANSIDFAAVAADTTGATYAEAYLLNCAPAEVEDEKDEFVLSITFDENGIPQVSAPAGKEYNVTIQLKGSNDLSTWTNVGAASKTYQFYKAVLAL